MGQIDQGKYLMLRIMTVSQSPEEVVLQVDGWLVGEEVDLLEQEGVQVLGQDRQLVLELQGVRFIDEAGIALLQGWSSQGLVLQGGSFIQALLKTHGLA
jgi:anti-anti-sigma regulatory factor